VLIITDWTEVQMGNVSAKTVARASSRMFGGTPLSHHDEWTNTMVDFTTDSFLAAQRLKDFPVFLRPVAKFFIPEVAKLFKHFALAEELIIPLLKEREQSQKPSTDLLQWMLDTAEGRPLSILSAINLHVAFAAIHTSAVAVTHIIYDLCAMPEYVEPLRQEIYEALAGEQGPSKKAFLKMPKLDSFMRESQRFNPLLLSKAHSESPFINEFSANPESSYLRTSHAQRLAPLRWFRNPRTYPNWSPGTCHRL